jgi:hypothetical protein
MQESKKQFEEEENKDGWSYKILALNDLIAMERKVRKNKKIVADLVGY